jgi:hypothetical protein
MSGLDRVSWTQCKDDYGVTRPQLHVYSPTNSLLRSIQTRHMRESLPATMPSRQRTPGDYSAIADAYRYFASLGHTPTRDISEVFGVPYMTAAQWVNRAREKGLLAPVTRNEVMA